MVFCYVNHEDSSFAAGTVNPRLYDTRLNDILGHTIRCACGTIFRCGLMSSSFIRYRNFTAKVLRISYKRVLVLTY